MRILVTAGATREPIDAVRFLSNISTGATGTALARALTERGHSVTVLLATGGTASLPSKSFADIETFSTAADLAARLQKRLATGRYDAVIMAAAVSDYRPDAAAAGKISSEPGRLQLNLVRNEKILPQLKAQSPGKLLVVGFKLTVGADTDARLKAVGAQFAAGGVDAVIHNDLDEIRRAAAHPFRLFRDAKRDAALLSGAEALADALEPLLGHAPAGPRSEQQQQQQ